MTDIIEEPKFTAFTLTGAACDVCTRACDAERGECECCANRGETPCGDCIWMFMPFTFLADILSFPVRGCVYCYRKRKYQNSKTVQPL
jgi:hypothetical protein